ncbi:MAG TPA: condensation domain-containing protein [Pseudonocardiaceae bacterium]|nr:condensation domain-containing protein [Pseudonocardiaceae bacterium]
MPHQILVSFSGPGSGTDQLSWGQRVIWRTIAHQGASEYLGGVQPIPEGHSLDDMVECLRFVMGRHQSLRTRLAFDSGGEPRQVVSESGEVPLEVVDAGDADPAAVAEQVRERYESTDFDYEREWPLRMAAVCRDGVPTHSVAVYNHLAIDAHGLDALMADLMTMLTGDVRPVTAMQPLEQAAQQRTAAARRQSEAALRHWERVLRRAAPRQFGESTDRRQPRYWRLRYHTPATELAMRLIAARTGTDTSPVLLAAYAVALARTAGTNPVVLQLAVSNRFRPRFADSVSPLAQASPCLLDVADVTFDEAVARAVQAAMSTYLNAYYDPHGRAALLARMAEERGEQIELSCYFNDRRDAGGRDGGPVPTLDQVEAAVSRSALRWSRHTDVEQPPLYLSVSDADDGIELYLTADTHRLSPSDMATIARTVEAVAVGAARDATQPTGVTEGAAV